MKTAMQELMHYIKTVNTVTFLPEQLAKTIEEKYLEKEKEQIIYAHGSKGWAKKNEDGSLTTGYLTGEQYYNQTYNTPTL